MSSAKFIRSNIMITFISLVSVGVNFISQMVLAYYFGAEAERDSYFSAIAVPTYIVTLFVGSLSVIFLPYFVDFRGKNTNADVVKLVSGTFGVCILFLVTVAILAFLFSDKIIVAIAPGYSEEQLALTVNLFRILIFTIIFQSLSSLITVFHHVDNRFLWPAITPVLIPLTSLLSVSIFHSYGIVSLAAGTLLGSVLAMLILFPLALRNIKVNNLFTLVNPNTVIMLKLALPLFTAGAIYRLTTIIERMIASRLPSGSISYLGYSNQLYVLLATLASGSIATTFYPRMSAAWSDGNRSEFIGLLSRGIRLILLITLPIAAILIALGSPIIEILFQRGAFDSTATQAVAESLSLLMGAFIFGSLGNIMFKAFYIVNKTLTISVISILEVGIYVLAGYILSSSYSYLGLAFSLTLSTGFTTVLATFFLLRWNYISLPQISLDALKVFLAAVLCGFISFLTFNIMGSLHVFLAVSIGSLAGVLFYLVTVLHVLKISDAAAINKFVKSYLDVNFGI
jgi:putative peptidoglycan lipid II flippase